MKRRVLSILLVLALCLAYLPVQRVYAATIDEITIFGITDHYIAGDLIYVALDGTNVTPAGIDISDRVLYIDGVAHRPADADWSTLQWEAGKTYVWTIPMAPPAGDDFNPAATICRVEGEPVELDSVSTDLATLSYPITVCVNSTFTAPTDVTGLKYDGTAKDLVVPGTSAEGTFSYQVNGGDWVNTVPTGTNAGDYEIVYKFIRTDGMPDYDTYPDGAATPLHTTIDKADAPNVSITGNTATLPYNGSEQSVTGFTYVSDNPAYTDADFTYTGTEASHGIDAGNYLMGLDASDFTNTNTNYYDPVFTIAADGNLVITSKDITVTITGNSSKVAYTGAMQEVVGYTIESSDPNYTQTDFTYTGVNSDRAEGTAEGDYDMTMVAGEFTNTNPNYNPTFTIVNGRLTIANLPEATWTTEPTVKTNLTYNGTAQQLVNAGVPNGGTAMYQVGYSGPWSNALPTATVPANYEVSWKVAGDAGHVDSAQDMGMIEIIKAPAVTIRPIDTTMYVGGALPAKLYTVSEGAFYAADEEMITVTPIWSTVNPEIEGVAGNTYEYTLYLDLTAHPEITDLYEDIINAGGVQGHITVIEHTSGGGGGGGSNEESYDFTQPSEGVGAGKMDDENWTWGERGNLPKDAATLYMVLSNNSVSEEEDNPLPYPGLGTEHFLASDDTWVLPAEDPAIEPAEVIDVRVCQDNEPIYLANGDGKVDQSTFGNSDFYTVGVGTGDTKIDYANLKTGDVVSNTSFNGVFVTKLQKSNNPTFDADLAKLKSDTIASFRAFELDHPEVFWLNGSIKLRVLTVTLGGEQTSFIFMTLVDDKGFTMRIAEYAAAGSIEAGIKQRDAAVASIIAQIPAGASDREKVVNLNKWFTLNNEYNRSADLSSIGFTPHRSLKSLMGNFGINGPVCDGYSRGFKTVCDRLGIPVVLETGTASIGSHSELHMWMSVKVDGTWYGMDTTWNDPIVKGKDGKVSGYENEKYLLVGNDTVVDGAKFGVSHPANKTPGGTTGVLFASLILNPNEIYGYVPVDYDDVNTSDWFYDYVQDVTKLNLMNGTSPNLFSPQGTATRGQIVQILYNIAGQPEVEDVKVEGWFGVPATWAMDKGIVAGYPDGDFHGNDPVTREQLATILWAFEGAPVITGTTLGYADKDKISEYALNAFLWAKAESVIGGKPGNLADPQGTATRAEIATIFSNYMK